MSLRTLAEADKKKKKKTTVSRYAATAAGRDAATSPTWTSNISKMRTYAAFLTVVAAAAAPFRHRGRDKDYWNVEDPDRLYGPLGAEPFEALSLACKRTAARLTRATATEVRSWRR